jgi:hypothetical protein
MKLSSDDRVHIAQAVWSEFEKRRGRQGEMSSAEFDLICKWMARSIPLPVILRGIKETSGSPRTLHACAASVDRAADYWNRAAGVQGDLPIEEWGPERAESERRRIMAKYGRE